MNPKDRIVAIAKRVGVCALTLGGCLFYGVTAFAAGYQWNNHAAPYTFLFNEGQHIDTHQQTRRMANGDLKGFFYIEFSGAVSSDGYRVASHTDCNDPAARCSVGWSLSGKPISGATLVYRVNDDHPTWLVDRADITQPGSYSHFHWDDAVDHGAVGSVHDGYLLQLQAVDVFCWVHGNPSAFDPSKTCEDDANNGVIVEPPGIDIATHVNIVGSYPGYPVP